MRSIVIFTDGSSRGNPGPGGWGTVIVAERNAGERKGNNSGVMIVELGGGEKSATNNRMELMAAIKGLEEIQDSRFKIQEGAKIVVYSDSSYLINGITKWIWGWKKNGWRTKTKESVLNRDLWEKLDVLIKSNNVSWKYVGGHVGVLGNERCDHIATAFADGRKIALYKGSLANYDLPNILGISLDETRNSIKTSKSARSKIKAYSYVSSVAGVIEVHHSWPECERRVKGVRGAKYKKSISEEDEAKIIEEFEAL